MGLYIKNKLCNKQTKGCLIIGAAFFISLSRICRRHRHSNALHKSSIRESENRLLLLLNSYDITYLCKRIMKNDSDITSLYKKIIKNISNIMSLLKRIIENISDIMPLHKQIIKNNPDIMPLCKRIIEHYSEQLKIWNEPISLCFLSK